MNQFVPNLEFSVRQAVATDAADLAELGAKTFLSTYAAENTPENIKSYVSESFSIETIRKELEDPRSAFLMVVGGDACIGYAKARKSAVPDCVSGPNPIELERIYVDDRLQGGGVGARLMQAVIEFARNEGCGTVWLGVWERNTAAIGFYERLGFKPVGTKYFTVGNDRQDDVVMQLILD